MNIYNIYITLPTSRKFYLSFSLFILFLILGGIVGNTSPIYTISIIISIMLFFHLTFLAIYITTTILLKGVKNMPSVGKNLFGNFKLLYDLDGDTEIDTLFKQIESLEISKIYDEHEAEKILKKYEQTIDLDVSNIEKKRLLKKSLNLLDSWSKKSSNDLIVNEGEMIVWLWVYNIVSKLTAELTILISKKEVQHLSTLLSQMTKYHTIYKLSVKGEYPECDIEIAMKPGEVGIYEEDALLIKSKSVKEYHGYSGFSTSIKIFKGFSYRVGSIKPITSTKVVQFTDDSGKLVITSDRIGFIGSKQNFLIPLNKIIQFDVNGEGLFIMKENSSKPYQIFLSDYDVVLLILEKLYSDNKEKLITKNGEKNNKLSNNTDYLEELEKLSKLKETGILTEEEFSEKKKKILGI